MHVKPPTCPPPHTHTHTHARAHTHTCTCTLNSCSSCVTILYSRMWLCLVGGHFVLCRLSEVVTYVFVWLLWVCVCVCIYIYVYLYLYGMFMYGNFRHPSFVFDRSSHMCRLCCCLSSCTGFEGMSKWVKCKILRQAVNECCTKMFVWNATM